MVLTDIVKKAHKLELLGVYGAGDLDSERVSFKVLDDVDLGDYVLTDSTYNADGSLSNKLRHVFEFQAKKVKAGEFVRLYTRVGTNGVKNVDGKQVHCIYWGLKETVWNKTGDRAFLLYAPASLRQQVAVV